MLIDTHCHLTDERLAPEAGEIISSLHADGIESVVTVGYDEPSSVEGYKLSLEYDDVYCAVGMHPHDSRLATQDMYDLFAKMSASEKTVAIGEIGLDYHYDLSPRDIQQMVFSEQVELANSLSLPMILHVREAYEDARRILDENKSKLSNGVLLHCYSGSAEMVKVFSRYDAYFSFGGAITFKNAVHNLESLKVVPADRLLFETDAPYMTPVPFRGKTNYPKLVNLVADKASDVLGRDREELVEQTTKNARTLFKRIKKH